MTRKYLIATILLSVGCLDNAPEDPSILDTSSGGDDVGFRAGPPIQEAEHIDKCCPILNGTMRDSLCADDNNDSCVGAGYPTGNGITSWQLVNCYTCGVNSEYSTRRWADNGIFGFECESTAIRRNTNALIDDDCSNDYTSYADNYSICDGIECEDDYFCPDMWDAADYMNGNPGYTLLQTPRMDSSVAFMCCDAESAPNYITCIPPFIDGYDGSTHCANASEEDFDSLYRRWETPAWCHACPNYSSGHATYGAWDLIADNSNEAVDSTLCDINLGKLDPYDYSETVVLHPRQYVCGGYLFKADGSVVLSNNCP